MYTYFRIPFKSWKYNYHSRYAPDNKKNLKGGNCIRRKYKYNLYFFEKLKRATLILKSFDEKI